MFDKLMIFLRKSVMVFGNIYIWLSLTIIILYIISNMIISSNSNTDVKQSHEEIIYTPPRHDNDSIIRIHLSF